MNFKLQVNCKLRYVFITTLLCFYIGVAQAQKMTIKGTVSSSGIPLPGVTILIENTKTGAVTNFDGVYSIDAKTNDKLIFSYIGFKTQSIIVKDETTINVELEEDFSKLDEVVVVGYGTLEKKELTGSQVSLKSEDIDKIQAVSFEEALQGKAAGVLVTSSQGGPGDAATIQIRGATSINASSAPLYVIDGVEIDGDAIGVGGSDATGSSTSSPLSLIDPSTIKSIEILKDANATSIYGSRGANGVVIIQTKNGKGGNNKLTLDLDISSGVQNISNNIDLLGAQEYVDYYNEAFPWQPSDPSTRFQQLAFRDNNGNDLPLNSLKPDGTPRFGTRDFRNEIFRSAILSKYSLNVRRGDSESWLSGNLSYTKQEGIVTNTDYKRIQGSVNIGGNISERLQAGVQLSGGRADRSGIVSASPDQSGTGSTFGVITNLALAPPVQGRFDQTRNGSGASNIEFDESGFVTKANGRFIINPIQQVNETVNNSNELFGYLSAYIDYKLTDDLKFRSSIAFNSYGNNGQVYFPSSFGWGEINGGLAFLTAFNTTRFQNNNTLTFDRNFNNKHKVNALLGTSILRSETKIQRTQASQFQSDSVNLDDLAAATNQSVTTNRQENGLLGIFSRINYTYDGRYVINVTARADKSSRFFPGSTQWGFFPSAGFTWNASRESFLKDVDFLSNLRLKASLGQSGNDKIGVFQSLLAYNSTRFFDFRGNTVGINAASVRNGSRNNGFFLARVSNPDLTWETTTQYDIGGEIGLFKNRLNIGVDWFRKDTKDLLLQRPTASQSGFAFILENVGEVRNKGFEFSMSSVNMDNGNFKWTTDFNISFIKNEVISLGDVQEEFTITSSVGRTVSNDFIVREGAPIGSMYGYESDGVYQFSDFVEFDGLTNEEAVALYRSNPDGSIKTFGGDSNSNGFTLKDGVPRVGTSNTNRPGQQKLRDISGPEGVPDGIVNENDLTIIGNPNPDHFGGITNNFSYKNWDLSIGLNWKYGQDVYNKNQFIGFSPNQFSNKYGVARDRWTVNNQNTTVHSLRGRIFEEGFATVSDYIEDASYLRLQNISIGYNLPKDMAKQMGISNLRIYGAADNVYVWTNYSGYDPDVSVSSGTNAGLTNGVDFDAYPRAVTIRVGLKASF